MSSHIDRTIDRLSAELRVLDRQNAWLEAMIENWDYLNVSTPRTRARPRHRSPSVSPPRDRLGAMLDMIEASEDLIPTDDETNPEEEDSGYESDASEAETVVYHTETWGFHPRGVDRGSDWWDAGSESDDETVVGEWEDPNRTPMRNWTAEHAAYFLDDSPGF